MATSSGSLRAGNDSAKSASKIRSVSFDTPATPAASTSTNLSRSASSKSAGQRLLDDSNRDPLGAAPDRLFEIRDHLRRKAWQDAPELPPPGRRGDSADEIKPPTASGYVPPISNTFHRAVKYLEKHNILYLFHEITSELVFKQPDNPTDVILEILREKHRERRRSAVKEGSVSRASTAYADSGRGSSKELSLSRLSMSGESLHGESPGAALEQDIDQRKGSESPDSMLGHTPAPGSRKSSFAPL